MLNINQEKAVNSNNSKILCLAGAGTGKTKTLVSRVDRLLSSGIIPENILCLTFTKLAGMEMKSRLGEKGDSVFIDTFHAFCLKIIKDNLDLFGLSVGFSLLNQEDRSGIIAFIISNLKLEKEKIKEKDIIRMINKIEETEEFDVKLKRASLVAKVYKHSLRANNSIDIDLLIVLVVKALKENIELRKKYHEQYKYVFVDEFQDSDDLQFLFIELMSPQNLFIVGDDYQAIYGFRGTNVNHIINISKNMEYEHINLVDNYRSTDKIVKAANNLISHNTIKTDKDLRTEVKGEDISFCECEDYKSEIENIAEIIKRGTRPFTDYCIITRTNKQITNARGILKANDIPVQLLGGKITCLDSRDTISLINLMILSKDVRKDILMEEFLKKEIEDEALEEIKIKSLKEDICLYDIISKEKLDIVEALREIEVVGFLETSLVEALYGLKEMEYVEKNFSTENIFQLIRFSIAWEKTRKKFRQKYDFDSFLYWYKTKTASDIDIVVKEMQGEGVKLVTAHGSKGLEFPIVFLVGLNEDLFPHKNDDIEESRRLCYVAVTRAKEKLYISWSKNITESWSKRIKKLKISRFIEEMKKSTDI